MTTGAWKAEEFATSLTSASAHTVSAYRSDLGQFIVWAHQVGVVDPSTVDRAVLRRYVASMSAAGLARRTMARRAAALRRYFAWAVQRDLIVADPSTSLRVSAGQGRLPRVLSHSELEQMLDGAPASDDGPEWRRWRDDAVLELLYGSGLRVSELCTLDRGAIDLDALAVTVWGKGSKERRVPISVPCAATLRIWIEALPSVVAARSERCDVRQSARSSAHPTRCPANRRSARRATDSSPRAETQLCHPSTQRRGRSARRARPSRSCRCRYHPALYPCQQGTAEGRVLRNPSASLTT